MNTISITEKEANYLCGMLRNDTRKNQIMMKKNPEF